MAMITLTVTDTALVEADYRIAFDAVGDEIDNGRATAAYFTGFYLFTIIKTPEFIDGVINFGKEMIAGITRTNPNLPMPIVPAEMVIRLEDLNVETGRMSATLETTKGDMRGEHLPTTAQIVATYMRYLTTDANFVAAVWKFADEFVANHPEAELANPDQRAA